jgi:hypothetical protein
MNRLFYAVPWILLVALLVLITLFAVEVNFPLYVGA